MMCPNYFASDRQALCLCHPDGLMCPSAHERVALCTARFEACPTYAAVHSEAERTHRSRRRFFGLERCEPTGDEGRRMEAVA